MTGGVEPPARQEDAPVPEPLRHVPDGAVVTGFDFSTGSVKGLAFDLEGQTVADLFPQELAEQYAASDRAVLESGEPILNHEEPALPPRGSKFAWILIPGLSRLMLA